MNVSYPSKYLSRIYAYNKKVEEENLRMSSFNFNNINNNNINKRLIPLNLTSIRIPPDNIRFPKNPEPNQVTVVDLGGDVMRVYLNLGHNRVWVKDFSGGDRVRNAYNEYWKGRLGQYYQECFDCNWEINGRKLDLEEKLRDLAIYPYPYMYPSYTLYPNSRIISQYVYQPHNNSINYIYSYH